MKLILLLACSLVMGAVSCGVKGDPEPPGTPVQIGRGRPTYKGLIEGNATSPFGPTDTSTDAEKERQKAKGAQ